MNDAAPRPARSTATSRRSKLWIAALAALVGHTACDRTLAPPPKDPPPAASSSETAISGTGSTTASPAPTTAASETGSPQTPPEPSFAQLVNTLSEPDAAFFSDNYISNETSYLHVADSLSSKASKGGVYLGVGPEQNFTYIALTRPKWAFIVDIRRQNMVLHLLYKALFTEATSRAHFIALWTGRAFDASDANGAPAAEASLEDVMAFVEKKPATEAEFTAIHAKLKDRISRTTNGGFGFALDEKDTKSLEATHRAFFKGGLDLRFELKQKNGRLYPKLRELLTTKDPGGKQRGFLATDEAFRFVQTMEKEHRIVPLVGDFAGEHAMPKLAEHLKNKGLVVSAFYVSNVEQYLFEPGIWAKWTRNVAAFPTDETSLFIRAYLDQGKSHPKQKKGHRTATLLQRVADFNTTNQKKPYKSFWDVVTDAPFE